MEVGTTTNRHHNKTLNGKTYYWCKRHTKDGTIKINGLWCLHKQADCRLKGPQHSSSSTGGLHANFAEADEEQGSDSDSD